MTLINLPKSSTADIFLANSERENYRTQTGY